MGMPEFKHVQQFLYHKEKQIVIRINEKGGLTRYKGDLWQRQNRNLTDQQ